MSLTKKHINKIIRENLKEMAMEFDPEDSSRPHPDIQRDLETGNTPLKNVPLPKSDKEPDTNFQELLASKRYKDVISNLRRYTGYNQPIRTDMDTLPLQQMMMGSLNSILRIESEHKEELENLAVEMVKREFGISDDMVEFDAKIVGMGQISNDDFNMGDDSNEEQKVDVEEDLLDALEDIDLERAKRRFINTIIQGASKKGHYMYHMVSEELANITGSQELINHYGIVMSINDTLYWQLGNDIMQQLTSSVGGKEQVDTESDDKAKIIARGVTFPILVHELIKGVMEVIGIFGRPENYEDYQEVESTEDTLMKEMWDLRLGPVIWEKLHNQFPIESLTDNKELLLYIVQAIFRLPKRDFFVFFKEVLSNSDEAKVMMDSLIKGIEDMLNGVEYEDNIEDFTTTVSDVGSSVENNEINNVIQNMSDDSAPPIPGPNASQKEINDYLDYLNRTK